MKSVQRVALSQKLNGFRHLKRELPAFQYFKTKAPCLFSLKAQTRRKHILGQNLHGFPPLERDLPAFQHFKSAAPRLLHEKCSNIGVCFLSQNIVLLTSMSDIDVSQCEAPQFFSVKKLILRAFLIKNICFKLWAPRKTSINWWSDRPIPGSLWLKEWQKYKNTWWFEKTSFGPRVSGAFQVRSSAGFLGCSVPVQSSTAFFVQLFILYVFLKKIFALSLELHKKWPKSSVLIYMRKIRCFLKSPRFWTLFQFPVGSSQTCKDFVANPRIKLHFSSI